MTAACFAWWRCSGPGHERAGAAVSRQARRLPRRCAGAARPAVEWAGAVCADGEDEVGRDGGAGRLVIGPRTSVRSAARLTLVKIGQLSVRGQVQSGLFVPPCAPVGLLGVVQVYEIAVQQPVAYHLTILRYAEK